MKNFSITKISALILIYSSFATADHHMSHKHDHQIKYISYSQIGNPADVLEVKTESPRVLRDGEVRVKVLAAPINPSDILQIAGQYGVDAVLPARPGSEGVGRVAEVSSGVKSLKVGQLVLLASGNTWAEELVAPAAGFLPLPNLGPIGADVIEQLAMSAVNPLTALLMLTSFEDIEEGQWIAQSAANSAVGGYVIQLAKQRGIKTVNIVRREGLADDLMAKGADVVLIDGPDLAKQIADATNNAPIILALDPVGGDTYGRLADSLGYGGTLVTYGVLSGKPATLNTGQVIFNDTRLRGFWLYKWYQTATMQEKQDAFGQVIPLIANGTLKANIDSRFTVDQIEQAVTRAWEGGRNGKVLIVPSPLE
ncbi:zinc-dependent alcohol dehydrogenase family protein [Gammaproteobacteria bacterium]|jgi:trans-2-enoyl-CoA reductase|nr:zinc-dependent alcohol dehydrogenase family protein [Gammaproteobacteria bacterium]|tara:strand:+ start:1469 stop:2569 length:1101 start_codon:yes stop_codon:yes gene_type:complete